MIEEKCHSIKHEKPTSLNEKWQLTELRVICAIAGAGRGT
jgi:hypothetical protein